MVTTTDIANMALGHIKQSKRIGNLDSEKSQEAINCRTFFAIATDEVLRDYDWHFATAIAPLDLVATTPNQEWGFAYRYPNGCLNFRKIQSGWRVMTNDTAIAWRVASDAQGLLIYTDQGNAIGEWTQRIEDTSLYPPDFSLALSLKIAAYIAPMMTNSDPYKLADRCEQRYAQALLKAAANASNEQKMDRPSDADAVIARQGYYSRPPNIPGVGN